MASQKQETEGLHQSFGLWSAISLGWLTLNVFGGMSFIIFFGLSAGGIPAILYGFIGSCLAVICIILTFAQCASRFSTAGLVNLCRPDFDVSTRWQLFLVYLAIVAMCWLINLWGLKGIPTLEILGCYVTAFGFIAYTIALLVKAPKASPSFVFVETHNSTGYSSTSLAILLGLFSSFSTLMGLDGPAHLAEEIPQPKRHLPRVMLIVIISQAVIGVVWILVLGFSITDMDLVVQTKTGHWNYGVFTKPIYVISIGYSILVVIVSALPQSHPVTSLNMNYTVLVMGGFSIVMGLAWVTEGRKLFKPPINEESLVETNDVIIGVTVGLEADEEASKGKNAAVSSGYGKNQSLSVTED
ncbi:hypothetical protein Neosp_015223 [[Neocosmospora] mangrovei]